MKLRDIWHDPVWSIVIATVIATGILGILSTYSKWSAGILWFRVPVWSALLMLIAGFLASVLSLPKFRGKTYAFEPKVEMEESFVFKPDPNKGLTFPLKCHAIFRNDSEGCVEVRVQSYEPKMIKLQQFVINVLQLELRGKWVPEPDATNVIAVLPKQKFRAWIGVDATKYTEAMVWDQRGNRGTLTLSVNGKSVPFQL